MTAIARRTVPVVLGSVLCVPDALANEVGHGPVNPWMILPFVLLLLAIAVAPFINRHWWERNYSWVSFGVALIPIAYYLFVLQNPTRMLHTAVEYVSFIALIGSLFVVAGGIHIRIKGSSTPLANVFLLATGAVVANLVGTTGASMILIRPYIRVNRHRIKPYHIVFFIFIVSNMGGALTPIGDPPLFLGYLKGVPFFWVAEHLWYKWAVGVIAVLLIFYALDLRAFRGLSTAARKDAEKNAEEAEVTGMQNVIFLVMILVSVFVTHPPFLREVLMVIAAVGSYVTTKSAIHKKNNFNFGPIKEVAILFVGIFATMVPALDWLEHNATQLGIQTASHFYWSCGVLSAVLDNAPTYLNFLSASIGLFVNEEMVTKVQHLIQTQGSDIGQIVGPYAEEVKATFATLFKYHGDLLASGQVPRDEISTAYLIGNHNIYLQAISIAAVFFGACTYIGNGPNFMVKAIAEQSGVPCPSFFGYIVRYTVPVLLPIFLVIWYFFFRGL